jgi:hypothetical protein
VTLVAGENIGDTALILGGAMDFEDVTGLRDELLLLPGAQGVEDNSRIFSG